MKAFMDVCLVDLDKAKLVIEKIAALETLTRDWEHLLTLQNIRRNRLQMTLKPVPKYLMAARAAQQSKSTNEIDNATAAKNKTGRDPNEPDLTGHLPIY